MKSSSLIPTAEKDKRPDNEQRGTGERSDIWINVTVILPEFDCCGGAGKNSFLLVGII
jgi:hypothetical protein